jgi:CheY-like chemotaxis protein
MGQSVLVADDSKTVRTMVEWLFKGTDYQLMQVEGGDSLLAALQRTRPGLIVLDYNMADRDGYEVCQAIKSNPQTSSIPVLMLGGKFAEFSEERANAVGADDFIIKPFRTDAFMKKVEALFGKAAAGEVKQLAAAAAPAARPAAPPPAAPAPAAAPPGAPPARPRFPFPGQAPGAAAAPPPAAAPAPAAPSRPSFSISSAPAVEQQAHTPQPSPSPSIAGADPATLREEVQTAVKELLPGIVRGVLKELITKEVTPHLQQWVEKRLDGLVEQKVSAEIARLRAAR